MFIDLLLEFIIFGFIICLRLYRLCNLIYRYFSRKNSLQFLRYLYACRNRAFFIFQSIWITTKNILNRRDFFSSSTKYYFVQKDWYIQWNHPDLELVKMLRCDIFSKKSRFLCDKSHVQKYGGAIACFFCTIKKNQKGNNKGN